MGIRNRLKSRVKQGLDNIKALAAVINEEANHPGRPQPHMAARNPMWGGEDETPAEETSDVETPPATEGGAAEAKADESQSDESDDFWFLKYDDVDGWDVTNPKEGE